MKSHLKMHVARALLLLTVLAAPQLPAQELARALLDVKKEIDAATAELNELRAEISEQRAPLAAEIDDLRAEVQALRAEAAKERAARRLRGDLLSDLELEVARLESESDFVETALLEYRRTLETYASAPELQSIQPRLDAIDTLAGGPGISGAAAADLLELAGEWSALGMRARIVPGTCIDAEGREIAGEFALIGPLQYFASPPTSGIAVLRGGALRPSVFDQLAPEQLAAIEQLVATGAAERVPVDVSGGKALKARQAAKPLIEHLKDGGYTMYPLLAIGLLALLIAAGKSIELAGVTARAPARVAAVAAHLRRGDPEAAAAEAGRIGRPLRAVLLEGVAHRQASREQLEEIMHERVLTTVPRLQRSLGALAVFGAVAPLLGLLGTVTGMIHTFQLVTIFGSGDAKMLSGGISEALVTTETGLAIAIPVLLVHAYLARRVSSMAARMEHSVFEFVSALGDEDEGGKDGDA
jgi:biopolymer transport protein ExbB